MEQQTWIFKCETEDALVEAAFKVIPKLKENDALFIDGICSLTRNNIRSESCETKEVILRIDPVLKKLFDAVVKINISHIRRH